MHATDIVGYTFAADLICPPCAREAAAFALASPGEAAFMGRPTDGDTCEQFLDRWAAAEGICRGSEEQYDSDDFPKVVFADWAQPGDMCGVCGEELLDR